MNDRAIELLHSGHAAAAAAGFRRAIQVQPTAAESYFNLGIALKDLSRNQDSAVAYLSALALRPDFPQAHFNLGRCFQMLADDSGPSGLLRHYAGRRQALLRAAHHFRRASGGSPAAPPADSVRSLEEVLHQLGDEAGAKRAYVELLRRSPQDGVRRRQPVHCERMLEHLKQRAEVAIDSARRAPSRVMPPRALCSPVATDVSSHAAAFAQRGYAVLPSLLAPEVVQYVAQHYEALAHDAHHGGFYRDEPSPQDREHDSVLAKDRWALDNDALGLFLAERLGSVVQQVTGTAVQPGFVKAAWYSAGSKLPPHRDQVQNLYSISLVLGASLSNRSSAWPLHLIAAPRHGDASNHEVRIEVGVNAALLFAGRDFWHHRPCCLAARQHMLVLLLHYVRADFPNVACAMRLESAYSIDAVRHDCVALPGAGAGRRAVDTPRNGHNDGDSDGDETAALRRHASAECLPRADAWHGALHDVEPPAYTHSTAGRPSGVWHEESARGLSAGRFLLYNPCVLGTEPGYCHGQLNNQLHMLWHAAAVASALQRTLVVPPFLWMANQTAARQQWFPASDYLDLCRLRRVQPVMELHDFVRLAQQQSGGWLPRPRFPPYVLPAEPAATADALYSGRFFVERGLRFAEPRLISPFEEVKQGTSGQGARRYGAGEGLGFWRAAALHLGRQQRELEQRAPPPNRSPTNDQLQRLQRHALELDEWSKIAREHPGLRGEPLGSRSQQRSRLPDALVLDFAPSYNFNLDCFEFDPELRAVQRAVPFAATLRQLAREARRQLFADEPYLAAHLRRDGYEHYCAGPGLRHYGGRRFGVRVTEQMCFPSVEFVAAALRAQQRRHGLRRVLLATNTVDAQELAQLRALVDFERWTPPPPLQQMHPERIAVVELLMCAMAAAFVGTLPSTFSATILVQRDLLQQPRNSSAFFGAASFFAA